MHKMPRLAMLVATLALSACGPSQEQVARQQAIAQQNARANAEMQRCNTIYPPPATREQAVPWANCSLDAARLLYNPNNILIELMQGGVVIAERYRDGFINSSELQYLWTQARNNAQRQIDDQNARARIVAAQERQARDINCMSARQNNMYRDESGLTSTNGAVAIISLLGVIGGAMNQAAACR